MTHETGKLGRNDPCWCGSGKLYKHCHRREDLEKEKEERRAAKAARARERAMQAAEDAAEKARLDLERSESLGEPAISPETAAANARWAQFRMAGLQGKIAIFEATLESGEMDAEEAYEMSRSIRDGLSVRTDPEGRSRYAEVMNQLRRQAPDLYRHDLAYYTSDLIDDALVDARWDAVPGLLAEFAQKADVDILLNTMVDALMYHGQTQALEEAMVSMWPEVSTSEDILPWGVDEFAHWLLVLHLLNYVERAKTPTVDDPALLEAVAPFGEYNAEWLETAVQHLSAAAPVTWQPAAFDETVDAETWVRNLHALLFDFMADQRRRSDVPLGRSYLLLLELEDALERQLAWPSSPAGRRQGSRKGAKAQGAASRRQVAASEDVPSSLVPRRQSLDRFLARKFDFSSARPYRAGVVVELLPAYLHFLARVGALHPTEMDTALDGLGTLASTVHEMLDSHRADPCLTRAAARAWSDAALARLREDPALDEARSMPRVSRPAPPERTRRAGALETFTFKVTYLRDPDVWRTIEMAEDQSLEDLHWAIQSAVDFDADHLYSFYMSNRAWDSDTEYSSPFADGPSADQVKIADLGLRMKQRFLYLFDYGDQHHFEVQLVATNPDAPRSRYPKVVESHGESPPQYEWSAEDEEWEDDEDWNDGEDWDDDDDWDDDEE